ncbi:MAG: haloacid dehalogenase, type II [Sphingomonas sp. 28-62-20]|uniref:haloacid dehalogenase type II n=1 Tax=Sphingomonas sp. 28-62-20 TaxID=1970433 RepID=UPI000BD8E7D8|nr:MAG: haloacid dehalogenase, type II [Sphingomonas sp. 28-62-20]
MAKVKMLAFDVFGTLVDWRTSIAREAQAVFARAGRDDIDPAGFADAWRGLYQPAMEAVRSGKRPFTRLDVLNRETLDMLLAAHDVKLDDAAAQDFAFAWRRLDPWPDVVDGLARLRALFPIVTLSNGNIALTMEVARRGGMTFDAILGAEAVQAFKPMPAAYLRTADLLGIAPGELCLVAAHHSDLAAARGCGLTCAYIHRPMEYGGATAPDDHMAQDWEWSAGSLVELAVAMGG